MPPKQHDPLSQDTRRRPLSRRRELWRTLLTSLFGAVAVYYFVWPFLGLKIETKSPDLVDNHSNTTALDWASLEPSRDLRWQKCYGGKFDCARLDVPLDWLDPTDTERVVLAVIRAPAKTKKDYQGPVFVNPGGPGGSGVSWLLDGIADHFQTVVGDNHDIISWDPRGIGASIPRVECWGSSRKRHDWYLRCAGVVDSHPGVIFDALAEMKANSQHCESYMNTKTPGFLQHLSTASHARDLLEISERAGFPMVKYWGVSYGTILGGTFAGLFPDRVGRLVSDGNVDYHDWYENNQINFIRDADKIMEAFFEFCHKAGPAKCAYYAPSPAAIQARFVALLAGLKRSAVLIPAFANETQLEMPELVTYSKFQVLIRGCLYKPIHRFPALAEVMAALEKGDGIPYYKMVQESDPSPTLDLCSVSDAPPTVAGPPKDSEDAFPAIMCADGIQLPDQTPEYFNEYASQLQNLSRYAGASNTHFKLLCTGRQSRPKWRFPPYRQTNTSFPILFIGNTADNVTPLRSARNNSAVFPGSVVLVQRSYGHCSLAAPSTCSARMIRDYFQKGRLPEPDTYCDQDYELFQDPPALALDGDRDGGLAFAVRELSRRARVGQWSL